MSMKISMIILLGITLLFSSCKDENSSKNDSDIESVSEENINSDSRENIKAEPGTYTQTEAEPNSNNTSESSNTSETTQSSTSENINKPNIKNSNLEGIYLKIGDEQDDSCNCYCVTINYVGNSEMCLIPSKISINTRMVKKDNQTTNIFLVNPSSKNTEGKDIPWSKFDLNTPIASITSNKNGEIELDWLGFSINGDLAIDYAILGKKTLEGNYKKK